MLVQRAKLVVWLGILACGAYIAFAIIPYVLFNTGTLEFASKPSHFLGGLLFNALSYMSIGVPFYFLCAAILLFRRNVTLRLIIGWTASIVPYVCFGISIQGIASGANFIESGLTIFFAVISFIGWLWLVSTIPGLVKIHGVFRRDQDDASGQSPTNFLEAKGFSQHVSEHQPVQVVAATEAIHDIEEDNRSLVHLVKRNIANLFKDDIESSSDFSSEETKIVEEKDITIDDFDREIDEIPESHYEADQMDDEEFVSLHYPDINSAELLELDSKQSDYIKILEQSSGGRAIQSEPEISTSGDDHDADDYTLLRDETQDNEYEDSEYGFDLAGDSEEEISARPLQKKESFRNIRREGEYVIPTTGVLTFGSYSEPNDNIEAMQDNAQRLIDTLKEFGIPAEVSNIQRGSTITRFEVIPARGIKLSKISAIADNIALRLAAHRVRIVAPIPGKEAVGIEIPNKHRRTVWFGDIVEESERFWDASMNIPIVLGEGLTGEDCVIDLTSTPHLLIAGATGSGKSVCVNTLICSILYRCAPEDVRLILIDPKIVELSFYNDIPHLLTPVITDTKDAQRVLQYCLSLMEERYSKFERTGVRDIVSFNQEMKDTGREEEKLSYVAVIIDEFADLMAGSSKETEILVSRLMAMSRAVGMHFVLATQRPSTDIITGLIKSNVPSRIAFMVSSKIDSRIIIDSGGAESLLGRGDMLFSSSWEPGPERIQASFLSEEDVRRVVTEVKRYGEANYIDECLFDEEAEEAIGEFPEDEDPLLKDAINLVVQQQKASTSYLQRRFKIGYNRAARLIDEMEKKRIIGPINGAKPREILVKQ